MLCNSGDLSTLTVYNQFWTKSWSLNAKVSWVSCSSEGWCGSGAGRTWQDSTPMESRHTSFWQLPSLKRHHKKHVSMIQGEIWLTWTTMRADTSLQTPPNLNNGHRQHKNDLRGDITWRDITMCVIHYDSTSTTCLFAAKFWTTWQILQDKFHILRVDVKCLDH